MRSCPFESHISGHLAGLIRRQLDLLFARKRFSTQQVGSSATNIILDHKLPKGFRSEEASQIHSGSFLRINPARYDYQGD